MVQSDTVGDEKWDSRIANGGNGKCPISGGFNGKIICHIWLPKGINNKHDDSMGNGDTMENTVFGLSGD